MVVNSTEILNDSKSEGKGVFRRLLFFWKTNEIWTCWIIWMEPVAHQPPQGVTSRKQMLLLDCAGSLRTGNRAICEQVSASSNSSHFKARTVKKKKLILHLLQQLLQKPSWSSTCHSLHMLPKTPYGQLPSWLPSALTACSDCFIWFTLVLVFAADVMHLVQDNHDCQGVTQTVIRIVQDWNKHSCSVNSCAFLAANILQKLVLQWKCWAFDIFCFISFTIHLFVHCKFVG